MGSKKYHLTIFAFLRINFDECIFLLYIYLHHQLRIDSSSSNFKKIRWLTSTFCDFKYLVQLFLFSAVANRGPINIYIIKKRPYTIITRWYTLARRKKNSFFLVLIFDQIFSTANFETN
jgi:hypothetical protein